MRSPVPLFWNVLARCALLAPAIVCAGVGTGATELRPYHELVSRPRALLLTPGIEGEDFLDALDEWEALGICIPLSVPGVGVVAIDTPQLDAMVRGDARVERIVRQPIAAEGDSRTASNRGAAGLIRWWNRGFETPSVSNANETVAAALRNAQRTNFCGAERFRRLETQEGRGTDPCAMPRRAHFAAGRCVVSLIYPESTGWASVADWQDDDLVDITAEVVRALHWWTLQANDSLRIVLVNHGVAETTLEPGLLPVFDHSYMTECLEDLGHHFSDPNTRDEEFNEIIRAQYAGHWAYTQWVINSDHFGNDTSMLAYAGAGGPYVVALGSPAVGRNYLDFIVVHEMGHIFQAYDEYAAGCHCQKCNGCDDRAGYLNERNGNCEGCAASLVKCPMRGFCYAFTEMDQLESSVQPCFFTRGMVGLRDFDGNGVWDAMETTPESILHASIPDTLFQTQGLLVHGTAHDEPYWRAPPIYHPPATINTIADVEYSIDEQVWRHATPTDDAWGQCREEFDLHLPKLGGGHHELQVRAVNSVGAPDPSPDVSPFFVHDVLLDGDVIVLEAPANLVVRWGILGEDLGSTFMLSRREGQGPEEIVAEVPPRGGRNERYEISDERIDVGREYHYRLFVDIPGKGRKLLGTAQGAPHLPAPPDGNFVAFAPNPSSSSVAITVSVPQEPDVGSGAIRWRDVSLAVYDVRGQLVRDLGIHRKLAETRFSLTWDGRDDRNVPAPVGIYFLRAMSGGTFETHRITILR